MEKRAKEMAVRFQNRHQQSESRFWARKTQNLAREMFLKTLHSRGVWLRIQHWPLTGMSPPFHSKFKLKTRNRGNKNRFSLNSLATDIVEAILAGIESDGHSITKFTSQLPWRQEWTAALLYGPYNADCLLIPVWIKTEIFASWGPVMRVGRSENKQKWARGGKVRRIWTSAPEKNDRKTHLTNNLNLYFPLLWCKL